MDVFGRSEVWDGMGWGWGLAVVWELGKGKKRILA